MKKPLVTRNDIAEAIALHTACIPTREIPGAIDLPPRLDTTLS